MSENQLRQLLGDAAELAPTTLDRPVRRRVLRTSPALLAAAAVVVVTAGAALVLGSGGNGTEVAQQSTQPAGTRTTTFRGLQLSVPSEWQDGQERCGTPTADTVLFAGGVMRACLPLREPGITSVTWELTIDGALCEPLGTGDLTTCTTRSTDAERRYVTVVAREALKVRAVIESADEALVKRIADTARAVSKDSGCDVRVETLDPGTSDPGPMVPGGVGSVTVCRYTGFVLERAGTMVGAEAAEFGESLNALPAGLGQPPASDGFPQPGDKECAEELGRGFLIRFDYPNDNVANVTLRLTGCGKVVGYDNGRVTGYPTQNSIGLPVKLVGFDTGFHDLESNGK